MFLPNTCHRPSSMRNSNILGNCEFMEAILKRIYSLQLKREISCSLFLSTNHDSLQILFSITNVTLSLPLDHKNYSLPYCLLIPYAQLSPFNFTLFLLILISNKTVLHYKFPVAAII